MWVAPFVYNMLPSGNETHRRRAFRDDVLPRNYPTPTSQETSAGFFYSARSSAICFATVENASQPVKYDSSSKPGILVWHPLLLAGCALAAPASL